MKERIKKRGFRMKDKTIKEIKKSVWCLLLILGIGLMLFGFDVYGRGYSNVNLSRDILKISYMKNLNYSNFADNYDLYGNTLDYDGFYILGMSQMRQASYIILMGAFLFGSALMVFLEKEKRK